MTRERIVKVLQHARSLVAAGWCQGDYNRRLIIDDDNTTEQFCLVGAMHRAGDVMDLLYLSDCYKAVHHSLWPLMPCESSEGELINWNDEDDRTQAEVLAVLDKTIGELTDV